MLTKKIGVFAGILAAGLAAAVPLRTCVILYDIDPKTGFYINGGSGLVTAVNILMVAAALLLMAPFVMKSFKNVAAAPRRNVAVGVITAVLAVLFAVNAFYDFYLIAATRSGAAVFVNSLLELATAGFFMELSRVSLRGAKTAFPYAALIPVIWATVHLMAAFMQYTTVVNVSEYLFDMLKMVFVMIFFYYHARYAGRVNNGNELKGMLAFGLPAVFFAMVSILPRYIALAFGRAAAFSLPEDLLFFGLAVYIAAVLYDAFVLQGKNTGAARTEATEAPAEAESSTDEK